MSERIQSSAKQRIEKGNKHRIRILHTVASLAIGGSERHVVTYANAINKSRFEVYVNYGVRDAKDEALVNKLNRDVQLIKFKHKKIGSMLSIRYLHSTLRYILFLYKIIKIHKIDIVHTHVPREGILALIAAKIAGVPTVYNPLGVPIPEYRRGWLLLKSRMFDKISDKLITRYIAVCDYIKNDLTARRKISERRVSVQYIGIDIEMYKSSQGSVKIRDEFGLSDATPVVGVVARLSPVKGVHKAIKAFPYVVKEAPGSKLLIIGDGPLRDELEQMCKTLGVSDSVIFTGFRLDVDQILQILNVYLQTSDAPSIGISTLEAMAASKPLVTVTKDDDEREMAGETISEGENGFVVPNIPERIAEKILLLLKNRTLARKQGQMSRRLVEEKFNIEKNIRGLEKLYESMIDGRS